MGTSAEAVKMCKKLRRGRNVEQIGVMEGMLQCVADKTHVKGAVKNSIFFF